MRHRLSTTLCFALPLLLGAAGCPSPSETGSVAAARADAAYTPSSDPTGSQARPEDERDAERVGEGGPGHDAARPDAAPLPREDPMALHYETTGELLSLFVPPGDAGLARPWSSLPAYFAFVPGRFSQGNKSIASHSIAHRACLDGLRDVVIQTPEQLAACHGQVNMVPIYRKGDPATAKACIDIFEFPNRACELPVVWGTPSEAERICEIEGKRLCSQEEWNLACAGDPQGQADRVYAYGDELDLEICNTNKPQPLGPTGLRMCDTRAAPHAWGTCATETEPSGAFPGCRSRFGVFDQHGNVAEMMTRREGGVVYTQLKGSAFFYVDVARGPKEFQKPGAKETYPDHCGFDPRWHVEPLDASQHCNYHLGFRCCLAL